MTNTPDQTPEQSPQFEITRVRDKKGWYISYVWDAIVPMTCYIFMQGETEPSDEKLNEVLTFIADKYKDSTGGGPINISIHYFAGGLDGEYNQILSSMKERANGLVFLGGHKTTF